MTLAMAAFGTKCACRYVRYGAALGGLAEVAPAVGLQQSAPISERFKTGPGHVDRSLDTRNMHAM